MNNNGNWQEKYLQLLDERDTRQRQFDQLQTLFRRAIVRVSLAAEGRNAQLDKDLFTLRDAIKNNGAVEPALEQLEATLLQQERQGTEDTVAVLKGGLSGLIRALQQQACTAETQAQLHQLLDDLTEGGSQEQSHLMEKLIKLQTKAFAENRRQASPKRSLLERLFKRTAVTSPQHSPDPNAEVSTVAELESPAPPEGQPLPETSTGDPLVSNDNDDEYFVGRDEFYKIASRLETMITDFIEVIEVADSMEVRVAPLRQRMAQGLTWFELAPALEDLRDLALEAYCHVNQKNHQYLQYLYEQIADLMLMAGVTLEGYRAQQSANHAMERQLQTQLNSMDKTLMAASDIGALKQEIESHLQAIRLVVAKRQRVSDGEQVASELESLESRLRHAEAHTKAIKEELAQQRKKATTDSLTDLPNREAYNERARFEWERMKRYGHPLILAVVDVDRFKRVNDKFGHQTGDRVLKMFSKTITQRLRSVDFMARYGGEEFVILLPETSLKVASKLLDMIRESIANAPFRFKQEPLQVTVSMGIVQVRADETVAQAFGRADQLLYQAKGAGRNQCISETESDSPGSQT